MSLSLQLADREGLAWAQSQVVKFHYLHKRVIDLAMPVAYLVHIPELVDPVGCLIFARPQCSKCYQGDLRFGSVQDKQSGKAQYTQWEIVNLARVYFDPRIQINGSHFVYNAGTRAVSLALQAIPHDYLIKYPPITTTDQANPYKLRVCLSYCDTSKHNGTLYRSSGFKLVYEYKGMQTYARSLRGLQGHERKKVEQASLFSPRAQRIRARQQAGLVSQLSMFDGCI